MMTKVLFIASLSLLAFFYGVLTMNSQIFPYQILREAKAAFDAWREVLFTMQHYQFVDENGAPRPTAISHVNFTDDDEYILMTGLPYTLRSVCPNHGCVAWIINRNGKIVHGWDIDLESLWADLPNHVGVKADVNFNPMGLHLDGADNLIVVFHSPSLFPYGVGIAKFSWSGNLIWKKANFSHHWFSVAPDGRIYTPAHVLENGPVPIGNTRFTIDCGSRPIYGEKILILDQDGTTIEQIPLMDVLLKNGFSGLIAEQSGRERCDPFHLNYVEYVSADIANKVPKLHEGDLVISVKHLNLVAVLDSKTRKIKWSSIGKTILQHSPRLLDDGGILVFDNMGGNKDTGGSRVVRLTYGSDEVKTLYPTASAVHDTNFWTKDAGHIDPHPDGTRALVSVKEQGRVLEIDLQDGRVLWELVNTHDLGSYANRLGADEGEIVRLGATGAYYVDQPAPLGD
jgi:hypothetical protein